MTPISKKQKTKTKTKQTITLTVIPSNCWLFNFGYNQQWINM